MLIVDVRVEWCADAGGEETHSAPGSGERPTQYRVCVTARGPDRAAPRVRWTILRRYSEFEAVESRLAELVQAAGRAELPGKALGRAAWHAAAGLLAGVVGGGARGEDAEFCRKRAAGLDAWAKDVRCLLEESSAARARWADDAVRSFFGVPEAVLALLGEQSPAVRPQPSAQPDRPVRRLRTFASADEVALYARTDAARAVADAERAAQQRRAAEGRGARTEAFDRVCARAAAHARDAVHTLNLGLEAFPDADLAESCAMLALRLDTAIPPCAPPPKESAKPTGAPNPELAIASQRTNAPIANVPCASEAKGGIASADIGVRIAEQDARIEALARAAQRQHAAGESLSGEVSAQNEALDRLREETARTDAKMASARGRMRKL